MNAQILLSGLFILSSIVCSGCASQIILNDKNPTPMPVGESTPEPKIDDFEARLRQVQTGNFEYIFAFRRKDAAEFNSEDIAYFRGNLPEETNQKILTADKRALVVGSNFAFPPENLDALKKRFKMEDYSPPKDEQKKEANSNR